MGALIVLLLSLSGLLIYHFIVVPIFLSPLSKLPNAHFSAPITRIWILWQRIRGREIQAIHSAHARCGPIVRLAPDEVSINCITGGVKTIYGAFNKTNFYQMFENYGNPNMFSTLGGKEHAERKRPIGNLYSKSYLQGSDAVSEISHVLLGRLMDAIDHAGLEKQPIEVVELNYGLAMDFISAYLFGLENSSDFLRMTQRRKRWVAQFLRVRKIPDWPFEYRLLSHLLTYLGVYVTPKWVDAALEEVNNLCLCLMGKNKSERAVVYNQLLSASEKSEERLSIEPDLKMASELMDHLNAGSDTTSITLTYALFELSRNPVVSASLRTELLSPSSPFARSLQDSSIDTSFLRTLDALPVLESTVMETLRLHPAVPGPQPRVVPAAGTTLAGYSIPGDTKVSTQAYSLHRNPQVFPEPEAWKPDRWRDASEAQRSEMMRWFWGFGGGSRGCIGKEFALMELKLILAALYSRYSTSIVDDGGIEQGDAYSAGPKGDRLVLQFERMHADLLVTSKKS